MTAVPLSPVSLCLPHRTLHVEYNSITPSEEKGWLFLGEALDLPLEKLRHTIPWADLTQDCNLTDELKIITKRPDGYYLALVGLNVPTAFCIPLDIT